MNIVMKKLADIQPYEKNPRKNDDAVKYVMESIRQFGFKVPIVVDKDGVIVAGHTRYKASRKLHIEEVPCIIADDLSDEQIRAYRLADNKVGELAEWDFDLLEGEFENIVDIDMTDFGFSFDGEEAVESDEGNFNESDFKYENQYGVTVILESEQEQEECYNKLVEMGYTCKVVTV